MNTSVLIHLITLNVLSPLTRDTVQMSHCRIYWNHLKKVDRMLLVNTTKLLPMDIYVDRRNLLSKMKRYT